MNDIATADRPDLAGLATLTHVSPPALPGRGFLATSLSGACGPWSTFRLAHPAMNGGACARPVVMYGLHDFSAVSGLLSPAFIVTAFLTGWPSLIAVLLNFAKRGEVRGSWLESHFRWQLRTFWYALLWVGLALLFGLTLIGIPVAVAIALVAGLWVLYRLIRGWLRLNDRQPMPV